MACLSLSECGGLDLGAIDSINEVEALYAREQAEKPTKGNRTVPKTEDCMPTMLVAHALKWTHNPFPARFRCAKVYGDFLQSLESFLGLSNI
jgi:hypothetical protein